MKITKTKLVCFSPTGTTRTIAQAISRGINCDDIELWDITKPSARRVALRTTEDDLLLVAVPVYMGRVPSVLTDWFDTIEARRTPTVCVVVYGNRAFDDALLELNDILTHRGCIPIAGAAFIGEHSFSSTEFPSSVGRPDTHDIKHAEDFSKKINRALESLSTDIINHHLKLPGHTPYGGTKNLWHIDFIEVNGKCNQCGTCAEDCPVGAIDAKNSRIIDKDKCTLCCACIKHCKQQARTMRPGPLKDAAMRCTKFIERHEPEFFF